MKQRVIRTFVIATMLICSSVLHGQEKLSIVEHEIFPHWYYFNNGKGTQTLTVKEFVPICKSEFGLSEKDELVVSKVTFLDGIAMEKSNSGRTRYTKYKQYYNGYEVESSVIISVDVSDTITVVTGSLVGDLDIDTSDPIAQSTALNVALDAVPGTFIWNDSVLMSGFCLDANGCFDSICYCRFLPKGKLCLARKYGYEFKSTNFKFVWRFFINTTMGEYRVLINAKTGDLFDVAEVTRKGYANGNVQTLYDGYIVNEMETYRPSNSNSWTLQNSKGNKTVLNRRPIYSETNDWIDSIQAPATTAHWIIGQLADFYWTEYHNNTISDSTFINAGINIDNYSIYTHSNNRIWIGKCSEHWLSTIDIVGHELAHRLVALSAELEYHGESGALNESFADIFGMLAERFIRTNHGGNWNWTIGEDACTFRSMSNPSLYSQPDYYQGQNWIDPQSGNDSGGIHTNSGVQNKWFYNLSQAIGPDHAGLVAYRMLHLYLTPTANYFDALFASVFAAEDLFGRCSDERIAVISAWRSVGITSNSIPLCARYQQEMGKYSAEITETPVIQNGNEWNTIFLERWGYHNYLFSCTGDTLIENVRYMKLMNTKDDNEPYLFSVFREEDGKIWGRNFDAPYDILYYDFTANVGDTLCFGDFEASYTVDSISIEYIGGVDRKKFWFGLNIEL